MGRANEYLDSHVNENSNTNRIMRTLDKLSDGKPDKKHIQAIADKFKMEFHTVRKMWAKQNKD